ncbi:MAG: rhomboid family intramembrane serine protease [Desulfuromonadaceae bacterium]|nr:rhomboid family intramembrane serine protease [Desulfuromonadaceae bacterium]
MQNFSNGKSPEQQATDDAARAEPAWQTIDPQGVDRRLIGPLTRKRARLWALVLEARGLPYRLEQQASRWQLWVPEKEQLRALDELHRYETENHNWPPTLAPSVPLKSNSLITLSLLALLGIFHNLSGLNIPGLHGPNIDWLQLGNADAGAILAGQWWRAVTALTLHADGLHLLGNLLIGGFFIDRLNRELGIGRGWALVLLAGTLGNLANALLQPLNHRSVGLSTAVFGTVAILAAHSACHHRHSLRRRWPLPLAAALALLGLLGSGGELTDIGGHLWGFVAGLGLGWLSSLLWPGECTERRWSNLLAGLGSAALVVGSWLMAFSQ